MATGQKRPRDPSLTFGSACSGLCAELFAAQILTLDVTPKFACDCDKAATKLSNSLWKHEQYFDNVWDPDFLAKAPQVDVFTAGFPCQPFSVQGLHGGVNDEKNGGAVVFQILRYIKLKKPKLFLLENVKGLATQHQEVLQEIVKFLRDLTKSKQKVYTVHFATLNARNSGLPQNRERILIVGIQNEVMTGEFCWPTAVPLPKLPLQVLYVWAVIFVTAKLVEPTQRGQ